jgi:redox-sensitive bicupin YhaK (pirin superfamily)
VSRIVNDPDVDGFELSDSTLTDVGGLPVHRALPHHGRRMIGAWCFLDRFGPVDVTPTMTMTVGPHPHMGLHTVTWLVNGLVEHTDSLGSDQIVEPGQLNVMTAGHGISHAEDGRVQPDGPVDGVQLWVAQPEATRHGSSAFAHHEDLPIVDLGSAQATVLLGEFAGAHSPATIDSALVGVDISGDAPVAVEIDPTFEYGLFVLRGSQMAGDTKVPVNHLTYFGTGHDHLLLDIGPDSRVLLLGGEPFGEEITMWWNFVARDRSELQQAYVDWQAGSDRFGTVTSTLDRIDAPPPYWAA